MTVKSVTGFSSRLSRGDIRNFGLGLCTVCCILLPIQLSHKVMVLFGGASYLLMMAMKLTVHSDSADSSLPDDAEGSAVTASRKKRLTRRRVGSKLPDGGASPAGSELPGGTPTGTPSSLPSTPASALEDSDEAGFQTVVSNRHRSPKSPRKAQTRAALAPPAPTKPPPRASSGAQPIAESGRGRTPERRPSATTSAPPRAATAAAADAADSDNQGTPIHSVSASQLTVQSTFLHYRDGPSAARRSSSDPGLGRLRAQAVDSGQAPPAAASEKPRAGTMQAPLRWGDDEDEDDELALPRPGAVCRTPSVVSAEEQPPAAMLQGQSWGMSEWDGMQNATEVPPGAMDGWWWGNEQAGGVPEGMAYEGHMPHLSAGPVGLDANGRTPLRSKAQPFVPGVQRGGPTPMAWCAYPVQEHVGWYEDGTQYMDTSFDTTSILLEQLTVDPSCHGVPISTAA